MATVLVFALCSVGGEDFLLILIIILVLVMCADTTAEANGTKKGNTYFGIWSQKGATLSDNSAKAEFGLTGEYN